MSPLTERKHMYVTGSATTKGTDRHGGLGAVRLEAQSARTPMRYQVAAQNNHRSERSPVDTIIPALQRLIQIASLHENWDSYGALAPSAAAIATASILITTIDEDRKRIIGRHTAPWMVAPVPDGGVQIEWLASANKIEVHIEPDGTLNCLLIDKSNILATYDERQNVPMATVRSLVGSVLAA